MALQCWYPILGNIETLAHEESISNLQATHVVDFSGTYIVPRTLFAGRVLSIIRTPLECVGLTSREAGLEAILRTTNIALERFRDYLLKPIEDPEPPIETLLSVSYNDEWPVKFRRVYTLFHPGENLPSFNDALCVLAPKILQDVSKSSIPVEVIQKLLVNQRLLPREQAILQQWIEDVNFFGKAISQKLLFSFLQSIVLHTTSQISDHERVTNTFQLAWKVHQQGLRALVDDHPSLIQPEQEFAVDIEELKFLRTGQQLPLVFPIDFSANACDIQGRPDLMILYSQSFLSLGIWAYGIERNPSPIPYLKIDYMDTQGRFFVTKRIEEFLSAPTLWEIDSEHVKRSAMLREAIARLVDNLIYNFHETFAISIDHLFLTKSGEIGTLRAPEKNLNYLDLFAIEEFIGRVCHENREYVHAVVHESGLLKHPVNEALRDLLRTHNFQATEHHIKERFLHILSAEGVQKMIEWHRGLQSKVRYALVSPTLKSQSKSPREIDQLKIFVQAFCSLQEEMGFVMRYPERDISAMLVAKVN